MSVTQYDFPLISEDDGEERNETRKPIGIIFNSRTMSYVFRAQWKLKKK